MATAEDDPHKAAREARTRICVRLEKLADEARKRGDRTAAQALAETYSYVAGVPHPWLDALRRELRSGAQEAAPWAFVTLEDWEPVRDQLAPLRRSGRRFDRIDVELVRYLPHAIRVTRVVNSWRRALGLRPLRYDARRSAHNVEIAWSWAAEGVGQKSPADLYVALGSAARAIEDALDRPDLRSRFLDPAEKGITFGSWMSEVGAGAVVIGASRNLDLLAKKPEMLTVPGNGWRDVRRVLTWHSDTNPRPSPLTVHFFAEDQSLDGATATLEGGGGRALPTRLTIERHAGQTVAVIKPTLALERKSWYRASLRARSGRVLARWEFTTR